MTRIWIVNWHFQSRITLWCRHKSTNFYGVMLTDVQVYCMTSMMYLFRSLTAKAIYRKNGGSKVVHLIYFVLFIHYTHCDNDTWWRNDNFLKKFKHNDFLHYKHFTTVIVLQSMISYVVKVLSKLNSTGFSNSSDFSFI